MHDTVFFWLHVWGHVNKWAFNNVHGYHHQRKAILNVATTAYDTWMDALGTSPPLAVIAWLAFRQNNWWALFVPFHTAAIVFVLGEPRRAGAARARGAARGAR